MEDAYLIFLGLPPRSEQSIDLYERVGISYVRNVMVRQIADCHCRVQSV
jgi:hypothetical protein